LNRSDGGTVQKSKMLNKWSIKRAGNKGGGKKVGGDTGRGKAKTVAGLREVFERRIEANNANDFRTIGSGDSVARLK